MDYSEYAYYFKALSDPKRVKIISMLSDNELCACKILEEFDMSQSTLSHHMKVLCDARLLQTRSEGKWTHYSIACETLEKISSFTTKLLCAECNKNDIRKEE